MNKRVALLIGSNEFESEEFANLEAPAHDVSGLREVLLDQQISAFDEVVAMPPTSPSYLVRREIEKLFKDKKRNDVILLYFSGHGTRDQDGQLHLVMSDTDPGLLSSTSLPASYITREIDSCRSQTIILILDCCHSGAFVKGAKSNPNESVGTADAFKGSGTGRAILTASDSAQYALDSNIVAETGNNSLFTHFLLKGLKGDADQNKNGKISIDELYNYAHDKVVDSLAAANSSVNQTPGKWTYGSKGDLLIGLNKTINLNPVTLPANIIQWLGDSSIHIREAGIKALGDLLAGKDEGLRKAARSKLEAIRSDDTISVRVQKAASLILSGLEEPKETKTGKGFDALLPDLKTEERPEGPKAPKEAPIPSTLFKEPEKSSPIPPDVLRLIKSTDVKERLAGTKALGEIYTGTANTTATRNAARTQLRILRGDKHWKVKRLAVDLLKGATASSSSFTEKSGQSNTQTAEKRPALIIMLSITMGLAIFGIPSAIGIYLGQKWGKITGIIYAGLVLVVSVVLLLQLNAQLDSYSYDEDLYYYAEEIVVQMRLMAIPFLTSVIWLVMLFQPGVKAWFAAHENKGQR